MKTVLLSHDSGSEKGNRLIQDIFISRFGNPVLNIMEDAAILENVARPVFTTDSFTVKPIFFPGGDIGKLAVAGSCNDLAVRCAKPVYMSASFIIEEGFSQDDLETITDSMKKECEINNVQIVCGDTKILPKGSLDGIFINTAAIGDLQKEHPGSRGLQKGHSLIVSGPVGDHAAVILMKKKGLEFESSL
ncbi:MAG: AIR synthase related protein, partial [Spirochaetia bacterium]|nr:AIR synthase related protein [Spirochaetia bacterium]